MEDRNRPRELWARHLDGDALSAHEQALLLEALADPDIRGEIRADEALDGALRGLACARRTEDSRAQQVLDTEAFARHTEGFVGAVLARLPSRQAEPLAAPTRPRRRAIFAFMALGALALFVSVGAWALARLWLPSGSDRSTSTFLGPGESPSPPRFVSRSAAPGPSLDAGTLARESHSSSDCPGLATGLSAPAGGAVPPLPGYRQPFHEPSHGTRVTRVTGEPGTPIPGLSGAFWPDYPGHRPAEWTHQPWSADGGLLYLAFGGGLVLDGETYEPVTKRSRGNVQWSPVKPDVMLVAQGNKLLEWNVRANRDTEVASLPGYAWLALHPASSPSDDGKTVGVLAVRKADGKAVCVLLDLEKGTRKSAEVVFVEQGFQPYLICASSPSGRFAILHGRRADGLYRNPPRLVFDLEGKPVSVIEPSSEPCLAHADLARDAQGEDVLVGNCRSAKDGSPQLIAVRLRDGITVPVIPLGSSYTSGRATGRPGWVYSSKTETGEVWATNLDTRRVERVGRVWSTRTPMYWAQPMCQPAPDGRKVVCASNWGDPSGRVHTFVVDIRDECAAERAP